ncbi:MAG: pilus assembly protein PilM [Candidatus Paceibacterota bacterium]|jgi:type IV pilus assembly protein PilM
MKFDFLKRICCPPEYLAMSSAGIEIGNKFIRFVEFGNEGGRTILSNFGEVSLGQDTVKDGQILNRDALVQALKVVKEKISSDFVRVSIPEEGTYIFNTVIPRLNKNEIRSALEFKLEENVPLKVDEAVFEYEIVNGKEDGNDDMFLGVSVISRQMINNYLEVFELADLKIVSFELESKMAAKAIVPSNYNVTVLVVDIKRDSTILSVVIGGRVRFSSVVSVGESSMISCLKRINKDNSVSDKIPLSFLDLNDNLGVEAFDSLLNIYSILKDEIEKFNTYWLTQTANTETSRSDKPRKIVFCGRSAALPGFLNHISQSLGIETILANVWVNAIDTDKFLPTLGFVDSLDYATAIGLAMPCKE